MAASLFREYRDDSWGLGSAGGGEVWWQLHSLESTGMTAGGKACPLVCSVHTWAVPPL